MPFSHTIHSADEMVLITARGEIDIHSCTLAVSALIKDPVFQPHYKILADLSEMEYSPSTREIRALASILGKEKEFVQGKVAVVVPNEFAYGMARMAQIYAEMLGFAMRPFQDLEAANQWLYE